MTRTTIPNPAEAGYQEVGFRPSHDWFGKELPKEYVYMCVCGRDMTRKAYIGINAYNHKDICVCNIEAYNHASI